MSAYTAHLGAIPIGGIEYRLARSLTWHIGHEDGPPVTVPAGFMFEVSVPVLLRWLFDPHDPAFHKAAALHDWLLENGWDRVTAGAVFHEALKADGVSLPRRLVMLLAVIIWRYE
ncbi:DUF1353 domain-containing protein [Pararhizobium haloflavum]|uniref:DUF1353 domain-containing protein n=1 Tax=Pararhizobium haloflavum TaxID=2037914 RepID=UPI000C185CB4|nr:DUF1353 domain-containing protein [Pararhizobium haloflavum]